MGNFKINAEKVGDFDEMDLNAFSIKPDALVYFTIAQILGVTAKGIEQGKSTQDIYAMKVWLVEDLQGLCEAQDYIKPEKLNEAGLQLDPYYSLVQSKIKELGLDLPSASREVDYWEKRMILSTFKFNFLTKRVFNSTAKFKELQY